MAEIAAAYVSLLPTLRGAGKIIGKELGSPEVQKEAEGAGKKAGGKMSSGIGSALKAGIATLGIAGIGAGVAKSLGDAMEREKLGDKTAAALGLTGKQSKTAGKVAGKLYAGAWGGSMEEVNSAVESVMSSIGGMSKASPGELKRVTAAALDIATAFDVDVDQAATNAGILMKTGLAKNATQAMDLITAGLQRVPKSLRGEVMDATSEYSDSFAALGLTGKESIGLLVSASENGQYGIDKMGDAIKEFTIRGTDMSKSTKDAYESIGLNSRDMTNELLAGGDRAQGAFQKIVKGVKGIKDPADQSAAAIALFGTPLEDLGTKDIPKFLDSLTSADSGMGKVKGAAKGMGDTLNDNFATKLEGWKRSVQVFASDGILALADGFTTGKGKGEGFMGAVSDVGAAAKNAVTWVKDNKDAVQSLVVAVTAGVVAFKAYRVAMAITGAIKAFTAATKGQTIAQRALNLVMRANPIGVVITAVAALVAGLVWFFTKTKAGKKIVAAAWAGIKGAIKGVSDWWTKTAWPAIRRVIVAFYAAFLLAKKKIGEAWEGIRKFFSDAPGKLKRAFGKGFAFIKDVLKAVVGSYNSPSALTVLGRVRLLVNFFTGMGRLLSRAAGALWNWVRDKAKSVIGAYSSPSTKTVLGQVRLVVDFYRTLGSKLGRAAGRLWDWLTDKLKGVLGSYSAGGGGVRGMLWNIVNFIKTTLPNKIKSAAKNIWSGLVGNALDVVGGVMKLVGKIPGVNGTIELNAGGVSRSYKYADGGVLPGYTPGRDVHDFFSPTGGRLALSGGEAIMRPEFTRAVGGAAGVAALNAKARRGQAFADGGIWTMEKFKAPAALPGFMKTIVNAALGRLTVPSLLNAIGDKVFNFLLGSGPDGRGTGVLGAGGSSGMSSAAIAAMVKRLDPSSYMTSGYRPGAITASGYPSYHGMPPAGRAADIVSSNMPRTFALIKAAVGRTAKELYFSGPGGAFLRNGIPGPMRSDHTDHIHVAMNQGGVLPKLFDQGGWMNHGDVGLNLSGGREAVLTPAESEGLKAGLAGGDTIHIHGVNEYDVLRALEMRKRRSRARANLAGR